jgi:hypothetical protein
MTSMMKVKVNHPYFIRVRYAEGRIVLLRGVRSLSDYDDVNVSCIFP